MAAQGQVVVVTGWSGFIGRRLVRRMAETLRPDRDRVVLLVRSHHAAEARQALADLGLAGEVLEGDVARMHLGLSGAEYKGLGAELTSVWHLAALYDLELSAAQNEGRGEIKSTPRVITANQREAIIEQGVEIPYQESASSGATTTQFKKAVLSLKVTPQITPDDRVILDLTVTKDSVGQLVPSATGGFVPSIDTRNIQTQVLVKDGQTVVLGGIMETERRDSVKKVPGLGDVPILGNLFKSKSRINNRDELLIFVTPKILREGSSQE